MTVLIIAALVLLTVGSGALRVWLVVRRDRQRGTPGRIIWTHVAGAVLGTVAIVALNGAHH